MAVTLDDTYPHTRAGKTDAALVLYPLAHMAVEVYNGMMNVMWPLFMNRFGFSFGTLGLLTMLYRGSMTLPQLGFASLADKVGSRRVAIGGLLAMALGMSVIGLVPTLMALVAVLLVAPLGSAAFHPAGTAHMSRAMPSRRATAVALFMIGGSVGMALGPLIAAQVYGNLGLRASPVFLPVGLLVAGLMFFLIRADGLAAQQRQAVTQSAGPIPVAIFLLMGVAIVQAWVESGVQSYLTTLLLDRGETLTLGSQALFAYSAAAAVGIFLGGTLADRYPRWRVIVLSQALCMPFYAGTLLLGQQMLLLAAAGLGFSSSLSHPVTVALAQEVMPQRSSLASALTMGISWVIGSLGVVLTGFLADGIGLQRALLLNTFLPVLGMVFILAVRYLGQRSRC